MRLTGRSKRYQKNMVVQSVPLPAPVGGWDAISPLANMPIDRAIQIDNWVTRPGWIEPRRGYVKQCTGLGGPNIPVETLMAYNGFGGTQQLFGVAAGHIYDCSTVGPAIPTSVTNLQNSRLQYTMFSNASSKQYLIAVNGMDKPLAYDGTSWTNPTFVGSEVVQAPLMFNTLAGNTTLTLTSGAAFQLPLTTTVTSGSVLAFTDTTAVFPGNFVQGPGIAQNTIVVSVTSSSVTMNNSVATTIDAGTPISFSPDINLSYATTTGAIAGVTTITLTSAAGLQPGYSILSSGTTSIPANTTVTNIVGNVITISNPTAQKIQPGDVFIFYSQPPTAGISIGNVIFGNIGIPDGSTVTAVFPTYVTINQALTATVAAGTLINFYPAATDDGIVPTDFIQINAYQQRLWFVPKNSTNAVYLTNVGGVSGPAAIFPLGQLMTQGGYLEAIGRWTVDTRQTVDEYIAFITSRGEIIVYSGTDPSTQATWSLVGIYKVGSPIGRRCFLRISGDLQIITIDGIVGMSEMLSTDRAAANRVSLTSIIMNQVALAAESYRTNFGWQLIEFPLSTLIILNVPITEDTEQQQYVMNSITGAWSRFLDINANCWEVTNTDLIYFGGNDGTVYQWNVGSGDDGDPITCTVKTAYNSFGNGAQLKRYPMLQPLITTNGNPVPSIGINVDFKDINVLSTEEPFFNPNPLWNEVKWNQFAWPSSNVTTDNWISVQGIGHYVSIVTQISTTPNKTNPASVTTFQLNGWNIIAESGAYV